MATKIQPFVKGQSPTLLDADRANEIVRLINGLIQSEGQNGIKVIVEGDGKLSISLDREEINDFDELQLQYVKDDNTVGEATFLIRGDEGQTENGE